MAGPILWTWMYNDASGSVLAVAVFHAGINAMGSTTPRTWLYWLPTVSQTRG
ncbi:hypothetical protein [Halorientalis pallida]|uniref:hypothetical protein n=1 Tax=Halorientalis pallida TaxID=2479928 RepID=UPI00187D56C7|nr:hypothetical protein [Halorientalis pallida]